MLDDRQLLALLSASPEEGIFELTKKYGGLIRLIVMRILSGNNEDIEECTADTIVRIWKNAEKINTENGTIKGYVACAARSIAIDRYRKLKRQSTLPLEETILPSDDSFAEKAEIIDDVHTLNEAINEMNDIDRQIFIRRYYLFESVKEIAKAVDMGEKAVESRIFRGRKLIKEKLVQKGVLI